ncbi:hypothetical protein Peur_065405 [Populus x canadensis]
MNHIYGSCFWRSMIISEILRVFSEDNRKARESEDIGEVEKEDEGERRRLRLGIWMVGEEQFGGKSDGSCCGCDNGDAKGLEEDYGGEYSMDYYAQDGGEWNSSYVKKATRPVRRNVVSSIGNVAAT